MTLQGILAMIVLTAALIIFIVVGIAAIIDLTKE
mgnify:CR=1 FL=1